jgi:hypothetical protein
MVALRTKSTKREDHLEELGDYIEYSVKHMAFRRNAREVCALVKSQSGSHKHHVSFAEPGKNVPYAVRCTCDGYKYNHRCLHMDIVDLYFMTITIAMNPDYSPVVPEMSPQCPIVAEDVPTVFVAEQGDTCLKCYHTKGTNPYCSKCFWGYAQEQEKAPATNVEQVTGAQVSEMLPAHEAKASQKGSEAIMPEKLASLQRPDDRLYCVWVRGNPIYLYWSEMTLAQRRVQLAKEQDPSTQRAAYIETFNLYN